MEWRPLVVALAVVLAGCPSADPGGGTTTPTSPATPTASPATPTATRTATPTPAVTAAPKSRNYTVNEAFVVGTGGHRLRYTATNVTVTDRVGGEFGTAADEQFVVVRLRVTAIGGSGVRLTSDAFGLASRSETYPADREAMLFVDRALDLRTVAPGATVEGVVVFDVSPEAEGRRLRIEPANATAGQPQYVVLD